MIWMFQHNSPSNFLHSLSEGLATRAAQLSYCVPMRGNIETWLVVFFFSSQCALLTLNLGKKKNKSLHPTSTYGSWFYLITTLDALKLGVDQRRQTMSLCDHWINHPVEWYYIASKIWQKHSSYLRPCTRTQPKQAYNCLPVHDG